MASDRPGLLMRRMVRELLIRHGEIEAPPVEADVMAGEAAE